MSSGSELDRNCRCLFFDTTELRAHVVQCTGFDNCETVLHAVIEPQIIDGSVCADRLLRLSDCDDSPREIAKQFLSLLLIGPHFTAIEKDVAKTKHRHITLSNAQPEIAVDIFVDSGVTATLYVGEVSLTAEAITTKTALERLKVKTTSDAVNDNKVPATI